MKKTHLNKSEKLSIVIPSKLIFQTNRPSGAPSVLPQLGSKVREVSKWMDALKKIPEARRNIYLSDGQESFNIQKKDNGDLVIIHSNKTPGKLQRKWYLTKFIFDKFGKLKTDPRSHLISVSGSEGNNWKRTKTPVKPRMLAGQLNKELSRYKHTIQATITAKVGNCRQMGWNKC